MAKESKTREYLGLSVVIVLILFVGYKMINYHSNVIEGLTDSSDSSDTKTNPQKLAAPIKETITKIEDAILIDKYRSDYENIIIDLEEWANMELIQMLGSGLVKTDSGADSNIANIRKMNDLNTFKSTLDSAMKFLDSKASKKGGGFF